MPRSLALGLFSPRGREVPLWQGSTPGPSNWPTLCHSQPVLCHVSECLLEFWQEPSLTHCRPWIRHQEQFQFIQSLRMTPFLVEPRVRLVPRPLLLTRVFALISTFSYLTSP